MSISISPNLPANVVEIDNEITQAKIDEINSGTLATQTFVGTNYAPIVNPTFTGIVTIPALTFPDGTTQTTATLTGPAGTNGSNGTNGANYMDLLAVTATTASLYVSGNLCYTYFGFLNPSQGWLFNKLSAEGVLFTAYVNGSSDNNVIGAFNGNTAFGNFTTTPTAGDVIEIYLSDPVTATGTSFPFVTTIY